LPERENIVVTRNPSLVAPGCRVAESLDAALAQCEARQETVVIGGASLYAEALPRAEVLYLTRVHVDLVGDAFFPELDLSEWREVTRREFEPDERHAHAFSITTLARQETNPTPR
jgi:dihydrofolate reductase